MDRGHGLGNFQRRRSRPGPILLANQRHRLVRNPAFHLDMWPNHFAHGQAPSTAKTIPAAFCQRGLPVRAVALEPGRRGQSALLLARVARLSENPQPQASAVPCACCRRAVLARMVRAPENAGRRPDSLRRSRGAPRPGRGRVRRVAADPVRSPRRQARHRCLDGCLAGLLAVLAGRHPRAVDARALRGLPGADRHAGHCNPGPGLARRHPPLAALPQTAALHGQNHHSQVLRREP